MKTSPSLTRYPLLLLLSLLHALPCQAGTVTAYNTYGTVDGQRFSTPTGILVDSNGVITVADSGNNAIKSFSENGKPVFTIANGSGTGTAQFKYPTGMAYDSAGNLWVADYNNHRLQKFDGQGAYANVAVGTYGQASLAANRLHPYDVTVGPDGNYWMTEFDRHRIVALSPAGQQVTVIGSGTSGNANGQFYNPTSLAFNSQKDLWVADRSNHRLQKFDATGAYVSQFGSQGATNGKVLSNPQYACPTSNGVLISSGNQVIKFGLDGLPLFTLGKSTSGSGAGEFSSPRGIAIDGQGNIWVADSGNSRVQKFNATGNYLSSWGGYSGGASAAKSVFEAGELYAPEDLEFDKAGTLWVTDSYHHVVQNFTKEGTYLGGFNGTTDTSGGKFLSPYNLTVDGDGNLWISDSPKRLRQYKPDGTYLQTLSAFTLDGATTNFSNTAPGDMVVIDNDLWVADYGGTRVLKINLADKTAQSYPGFYNPWGLARASDGHLWVADLSNGRVVEMDTSGLVIRAFSETASQGDILKNPWGVAVDQADGLWVTDRYNNRLLHYDKAGTLTHKIGGYNSKFLVDPAKIALAPDGSVWVASFGNDTVYHFAADGACLTKIDNTSQAQATIDGPIGIATYADTATPPNQYVLVSDYYKKQVLKFKTDGSFVATLSVYGSGLNQVNSEASLAVVNNELLIADYNNSRLKILSPDGAYKRAYTTNGDADWPYLNLPGDVAYNAKTKTLWVTDTANSRLRVLNEAGTIVKTIGGPGCGLFGTPEWLYADAQSGHVWVSDTDTDQVVELDSDGNLVSPPLGGGASNIAFSSLRGTAGLTDGSFWAADAGHHQVMHLKADGIALTVLGTGVSGLGNDQFKTPEGVLSSGDNLYVADTENDRIQKFSSQGVWQQTIGAPGATLGALNGPTALALDLQGRLWVVERDNNRVQVFAADGTALFAIGDSSLFKAPSGGLAIDAAGKVWVADTNNHRVMQFAGDNTDTPLLTLGKSDSTSGSKAGEFNQPHGIAIDSLGNIHIADTGNNRVQVFSPAGNFLRAYGGLSSPMGLSIAGGTVTVGDSGNSRVARFKENGSLLSATTDNGTRDTGFNNPKGVTRDAAGNLWVADSDNNRLLQFSANGTLIKKISALLDGPRDLQTDKDGNLWVVSRDNGLVVKYSANGAVLKVLDNGGQAFSGINNPADMVFLDGNLYLVDRSNHRVLVQDSQGQTLRTFGSYGDAPGLLHDPWGITVGPDNTLWISQTYGSKITVFTPNGDLVKTFGSDGALPGMLNAPHGLAFASDGTLWVVNSGAHRLDHFAADGGYLTSLGSYGASQGLFSTPQDVAIDSQGHLLVSDSGNGRIAVFDAAGNFLTTFGESTLGSPSGLALDSHGVLWVLDASKDQIFAFTPQGDLIFQGSGNGADLGKLQNPTGLAIDAAGTLWVADDYSNTDKVQAFTLDQPTGLTLSLQHRHWRFGSEANHVVDVVPGALVLPQVQGTVALGSSSGSGNLSSLLTTTWTSSDEAVASVAQDGTITAKEVGQASIEAKVGTETLSMTVNVVADAALPVMVLGYQGANLSQYNRPSLLFAGENTLYVADHDNKRIILLDLTGNVIGAIHDPDHLGNISGLTVDSTGNILVSDITTHQVHKYDKGGKHLMAIGLGGSGSAAGQFNQPQGLALDAKGNLWVADRYNNRLQQFNASTGAYLGGFGQSGTNDINLNYPTDVAVDPDGSLWVAESSKLKHFAADGQTVLAMTANISPRSLGQDAEKNLWVRCDDGTIRKFSPALSELMKYDFKIDTTTNDDPAATLDNPQGLAVDAQGSLWVSEWDNNRLQRLRFLTTDLTLATSKPVVLDNQQINAIATYGLTTTVAPTEIVNSLAQWGVSDKAMATVDQGKLTATKTGPVQVSATFNGHSDSLSLEIMKDSALEESGNTSKEKAYPIIEAQAIKGYVSGSEHDWFSFTPSANGYYTILFSSSLPSSYIGISIVDAAGKTIYSTSNTVALAAPIFLEGQVPYFIKVDGYTSLEQYLIGYAKVADGEQSTVETSLPLTIGETVTGLAAINSGAYYRFKLDGPRQLLINYQNPGSTTTMELTVYPEEISETTVLDKITSTKGEAKQIAIGLNQGTYYLHLQPSGAVDQGQYSLAITPNPLPTAGEFEPNNNKTFSNTLDNGKTITARNYSSSDADYYSFHYAKDSAADLLTLDFTPLDNKGSHTITLWNLEDKEPITTLLNSSNKAVAGQEFNIKAGQYFLKVKDGSSNRTEYQLTVNGKISPIKKVVGVSLASETPVEEIKVNSTVAINATVYWSDGTSQENPEGLVWSCTAPVEGMDINNAGVLTVKKSSSGSVVASFAGKLATLELSVGVAKKQAYGNLIIVAGGGNGATNKLYDTTQYLSDLAYQKFKGRGLSDDDILYFTPEAFKDLDGNGFNDGIVDSTTISKESFATAISDWATSYLSTGPLFIYLNDHGATAQFQLAPGQVLFADELKNELKDFQKKTDRAVVVIIEACHSGTFVEPLMEGASNRVVITSADNGLAYLGDGGSASFSQFFLGSLYKGASLSEAYADANQALADLGKPYATMYPQAAPGNLATSALDFHVVGDFKLAPMFPEFDPTTPPVLAATYDAKVGAGYHMQAKVTGVDHGKVWATIKPTNYTPPDVSGDFATPEMQLPMVELLDADSEGTMDGVFDASYSAFSSNGVYDVVIFARDAEGNITQTAVHTLAVSGLAGTEQSLKPSNGWSLLSSTIGFQVEDKFADKTNFVSVWKWDTTSGQGKWSVYLAGEEVPGSYAGSKGFTKLSTINPGEGFWVNSNGLQSVTISGPQGSGNLSFTSGWNLVGLKGDQASTAAAIVSGEPTIVSIWKWDTTSGQGKWSVYLTSEGQNQGSYANSKGFISLDTIKPGEGFWVNKDK